MEREVKIQSLEELVNLVKNLEGDFIIHVEPEVRTNAKEEAEHRQ